MVQCTCPVYRVPDASPAPTGSCPVHAPWPKGKSPQDKIKIRDEALRIVTGGDAELISSLIAQARENLGIEQKGA